MWRNYTNSEFLRDFGLKNTNFDLRARFPAIPNSPTPKSHKHPYLRYLLDTVQGLGLVLVRNDQPFDLPCPYGEYGGSGVYGGVGGIWRIWGDGSIFNGYYLNKIVPLPAHLTSSFARSLNELPTLKV